MPISPLNPNYVNKEFVDETIQFGDGLRFGPGAKQLGFTDPNDPAQLKNYLAMKRADGTSIGRMQHNSPASLYCVVLTATKSVNASVKTLTEEGVKRFMTEVVKPAADTAMQVYNAHVYVRETINGKRVETKANLIGMGGGHVLARDGNVSVHWNELFPRWAVTEDGRTLSLADRRDLYRSLRTAEEVFQLSLAVNIERVFGVQVNIVHGKAEIPNLPKQLLDTLGTRRQAMKTYLAEKNIPETPAAMAVAAKATRPEKKTYIAAERVKTWNAEAGKVSIEIPKSDKGGFAAAMLQAIKSELKAVAQVYKTAYKATHKSPTTVKVFDVPAFLEDTRKRTRIEGHKAALKAIRKTKCRSFMHALEVAEAGYKHGRKPLKTFAKNTIVAVPAKVAREMSARNHEDLRAVCLARGWHLVVAGQIQTSQQGQSHVSQAH